MSGWCKEFNTGSSLVCIGVWTQIMFGVRWSRYEIALALGPFELTVERIA